ncbi:hypothetical protein HYR99_26635 [Candidatus Poribacteria bacterium]|nr:hypothetical protein [Candidatus Poribacteria bacterium]
MKTQKFSEERLREMVDGLLKRHVKIGHDRLLLAVWFGEKDQTGEVHLLEVFANQPPSFSGYLETFEFGPSNSFPARLYLVVAAPADLEAALANEDKTLRKILMTHPKVIFSDIEGESLWRKLQHVQFAE